jgi:hypothetical protein
MAKTTRVENKHYRQLGERDKNGSLEKSSNDLISLVALTDGRERSIASTLYMIYNLGQLIGSSFPEHAHFQRSYVATFFAKWATIIHCLF